MDAFVARSGARLAATAALLAALALAAFAGCSGGSGGPPAGNPNQNTGADGGAEPPDAGGGPDAGLPDAGVPDAGPPPDAGFTFGQPSPWPNENRVYAGADGIQEAPVVGVTTDEAQNLWVATHTGLYLLKPGEKAFKRYSSADGLHLMDNPQPYRNELLSLACGGGTVSSSGGAVSPGIISLEGGAAGEVFVGYAGVADVLGVNSDCTDPGEVRHSGKIDRVRLAADGTLQVERLDLASVNAGMQYWHNRTIFKMVYDHGQVWGKPTHHGYLWVGANHGVVMIKTDAIRLPNPGEWPDNANREWMGDHVHAQVCFHEACPQGAIGNARMGDWRGLAIASDGDTWHAGKWAAGKIRWTASPSDFTDVARSGQQIFSIAFGDPYPGNPPVFFPPAEGDPVSLSAVAVTPDDHVWFGSQARDAGETNYGLATFKDHEGVVLLDPFQLGMAEGAVQDIAALPDGRVVLAGPSTGLTIYDPATKSHVNIRAGQGIPDDRVLAMELDDMVVPPALHVATRGGAAVITVFPK
ncbi:MAG TPA: WD40 repeat domain-containing protein [Anaeromyxobacteraceae bacterium]|nr:WD40 repeat domain-containing protein [Anaeromyxobacteraceae bacterium]